MQHFSMLLVSAVLWCSNKRCRNKVASLWGINIPVRKKSFNDWYASCDSGWKVLSTCTRLLASVGAACHSDSGDKYELLLFLTSLSCNQSSKTIYLSIRPSDILLSCGISDAVAANALRLSVGRSTTKADVDAVIDDLKETVQLLRLWPRCQIGGNKMNPTLLFQYIMTLRWLLLYLIK